LKYVARAFLRLFGLVKINNKNNIKKIDENDTVVEIFHPFPERCRIGIEIHLFLAKMSGIVPGIFVSALQKTNFGTMDYSGAPEQSLWGDFLKIICV